MSENKPDLRAIEALVAKGAEQDKRIAKLERAGRLSNAAIDAGSLTMKDQDGNPVAVWDTTGGSLSVTYPQGPTPATPTAPTVAGVTGALIVQWDGTYTDDAPAPTDLSAVHVYANPATGLESDDPDDPVDPDLLEDDWVPDLHTLVGVITSTTGGTISASLDPGTYDVRLVAVTLAGIQSEPTAPVEATVPALADDPELDAALVELDQKLSDSEGNIDAAKERLDAAEGRLDQAEQDVAEAAQDAKDAGLLASQADGKATSAGQAASDAQEAADQAGQDAATAAGIAAGKGDVLIGDQVPAEALRKPTTLWIDTRDRTNLFVNPSFESGLKQGDLLTGNGGGARNEVVTDWADTGTQSLKITPNGSSNAASFYPVSNGSGAAAAAAAAYGLVPGSTWTLAATIRITAVQTGTLDSAARKITVGTVDGAGATNYVYATSSQAPNAAGVTRLSVTFTVPATATGGVFFRLMNGSPTTPVYWDSMTLESGSTDGSWFTPGASVNTPRRWDGYTWAPVTDATAVQAAQAAAAAQKAANDAMTAAGAAQDSADSALTMAGKKSTVYYSTANPSGTGTTTGDVWRKIDGSKNVIGEWYWNGSGWQASQITTQMISNLDVGKLTSGTAAINNAVISKLFAEIFAAKKISATEADIQSLTAAVAQIIQLDVSQLVVTGSGTFNEAVIKKLWAQTLTVVDLIADAINGKTIKGNLISGADIEGSTFRLLGDQSGPGSGSGYDFEINRDNGGAYLGFHIGGETTPGTIRVFDSDPAYATDQPTLVMRPPNNSKYPSRTALRLLAGTSASGGDHGQSRLDFPGNFSMASELYGKYPSGGLKTIQINDSNPGGDTLYTIKSLGMAKNTTVGSANVYISDTGYLYKGQSLSKFKLSIEPIPEDQVQQLLDLDPVWFFDRGEAERLAEYETVLDTHGPEAAEAYARTTDVPSNLKRKPGLIAEDVAEKAPAFATYDYDGQVDGVAYERIGAALIRIVKQQRDQIADLTARLEALEAKEKES